MNKVLYSIIAVLLAGLIYSYIQQRDSANVLKNMDYELSKLKLDYDERNEEIALMENLIDQLNDTVKLLQSENASIKNKPIIITKIVKKNEKVIPVSHSSSEYFINVLTKRYKQE